MLNIKIIFGIMDKNWKIKHDVIRHYDKIARIYNTLYGHEQELKIKEILKILDLGKCDVILDAGCGTGLLFNYIRNSARLIVGVDLSLMTLKIALRYIKEKKINNISLIRADVDFLPFKNEVFDKVFAITLIQNMPNPTLTICELSRVAKDSSSLIITGLKKFFSKNDFSRLLLESNMHYLFIDTDENVKCYLTICSKNKRALNKSINKRIRIKMLVVK